MSDVRVRRLSSWSWLAAILLLPLVGCPARIGDAAEPAGGEAPLLLLERVTSMHQGMGSSVESFRVGADGAMQRCVVESSGVPRSESCGTLDEETLGALRELTTALRASAPRSVYDTSALPGPNANYSVHERLVVGDGEPLEIRIEGWADVPAEVTALRQWVGAQGAGCRAEDGAADSLDEGALFSGCRHTDPADIYRSVRLCIGPPDLPEGRFTLEERQVVPDATLSATFAGTVAAEGTGVRLAAETSRSRTVNEQLGTSSDGPEGAVEREWHLRGAGEGEWVLVSSDGEETALWPE